MEHLLDVVPKELEVQFMRDVSMVSVQIAIRKFIEQKRDRIGNEVWNLMKKVSVRFEQMIDEEMSF